MVMFLVDEESGIGYEVNLGEKLAIDFTALATAAKANNANFFNENGTLGLGSYTRTLKIGGKVELAGKTKLASLFTMQERDYDLSENADNLEVAIETELSDEVSADGTMQMNTLQNLAAQRVSEYDKALDTYMDLYQKAEKQLTSWKSVFTAMEEAKKLLATEEAKRDTRR
jgi:RecG-like helicase